MSPAPTSNTNLPTEIFDGVSVTRSHDDDFDVRVIQINVEDPENYFFVNVNENNVYAAAAGTWTPPAVTLTQLETLIMRELRHKAEFWNKPVPQLTIPQWKRAMDAKRAELEAAMIRVEQ